MLYQIYFVLWGKFSLTVIVPVKKNIEETSEVELVHAEGGSIM